MSDPIRTVLARVKELGEGDVRTAGELAYLAGKVVPLARALEAVLEVCDGWQARGHHMICAANDMPEDVQDGIRDGGYNFIHRAADIRKALTEHLGGDHV